MTELPKPLTADEVAAIEKWAASYFSPPFQYMAHGYFLRLIATIEQQAEQIVKLREALTEISLGRGPFNRDPMKHAENTIEAMKKVASEALAPTEPVNDKR